MLGGRRVPGRHRGLGRTGPDRATGAIPDGPEPLDSPERTDGPEPTDSPEPAQGPDTAGRPAGHGPFDVAAAPRDGRQRADFGALLVPRVAGTWIGVSTAAALPALVVTDGTSALELSVLAAPRGGALWETIRTDLLDALPDGTEGECADGPYGPELRMPIDAPAGPLPARILGIDGPRWFLCGVITGAAAQNPDAAPLLDELLRATVVVRGDAAMPVRDPLLIVPPAAVPVPVAVPEQRRSPDVVRLGPRGIG